MTAMRITPIAAIVLRQLYLLRGSASRVAPLFVWVAIDIVLWGFMTSTSTAWQTPDSTS